MTANRSSTGRPRDQSIDARAIEATRALLVESGFAGTTVQAVAKRSGVHASAIYRRWPTRLDLIYDAAFADLPPGRVRPTGDLRHDLLRFLRAYVKTFEAPVVRAAVPGLIAGGGVPSGSRSPQAWADRSVRPRFRQILAAAPDTAVDPAVDVDAVFDLVLGAVLVRILVPADIRNPPRLEDTVELIVRLVTPVGADTASPASSPSSPASPSSSGNGA